MGRRGILVGEVRTWALDVADNASGSIVHELDSDLCDTSSRACTHQLLALHSPTCSALRRTSSAENAGDLDELDGDL
jgi:hypothetical protein